MKGAPQPSPSPINEETCQASGCEIDGCSTPIVASKTLAPVWLLKIAKPPAVGGADMDTVRAPVAADLAVYLKAVKGTGTLRAELDTLRTFRAAHDTPTYIWLHFGSGRLWGIGVWGSGGWGGSGETQRLLCGEVTWQQRGLVP